MTPGSWSDMEQFVDPDVITESLPDFITADVQCTFDEEDLLDKLFPGKTDAMEIDENPQVS